MDRAYRQAYNAAYTPEHYRRYLGSLEETLGVKVPFRVAETPFFLPRALRDRLAKHACEIVELISQPALIDKLSRAVPPHLDVPRRDALANCIQVDFAIVRDARDELDGRLVELQGFPSLYAFTAFQAGAMEAVLRTMPGLDRAWTPLFGGLDRERYVELLRRTIVADCRPEEVILMDLDPPSQKTSPDFVATKKLLGVDAVCPTTLEREGRTLFRRVDGKRVAVRRIFNRVVFDELLNKGITLPFAYTDDLDVTWVPHPNWYWIWSKYTVPHLDHPAVPRARLLSDITTLPEDLSNYVLKPLFSFAGSGVKVDVTREDVDAIPEAERAGWMLQEKITYEPGLVTPEGHGVKAEVRMMFLRAPDMAKPQLVLNLTRLSRGKMLGVDQNKNLDWVGGSVGLWPAGE
jgi:hypothetical protein